MKLSKRTTRQILSATLAICHGLVFTSSSYAAEKQTAAKQTDAKPAAQQKLAQQKNTTQQTVQQQPQMTAAQRALEKKRQETIRWAGPDKDLFPISVTNGASSGSSIPSDPFLPPANPAGNAGTTPQIPTFPTEPFQQPGNPFPQPGNPFPMPTGTGTTFPASDRTMTVAAVPAEFSCPLFESNPFESIFRALDSMNQAIQVIPECQAPKGVMDDMTSNSQKIKNAVLQMQALQANPELIQTMDTKEIERIMNDAVIGTNNIANSLTNNRIFSNKCGGKTTSSAKLLTSLNDVVNNLAPVALVIASVNPGIAVATRLALLGGVVASGTISSFGEYMKSRELDMNNPEIRKAILQNTCQFVKIYQKINFLRYRDEQALGEIRKNLNYSIKQYQARYQTTPSTLLPLLKYRYNTEKMFAEIETSLAQDRAQLNYFKKRLAALKDDEERICYLGNSLVKAARIPDNSALSTFGGFGSTTTSAPFPLSLISNLDRVTEALQQSASSSSIGSFGFPTVPVTTTPSTPPVVDPAADPTADPGTAGTDPFSPFPGGTAPTGTDAQAVDEAEQLFMAFKSSRNRVAAFFEKINDDPRAIKGCSDETKRWMTRMSDLMEYTASLVNSERTQVAKELGESEEYRVWAVQYERLRAEKRSVDRVTRVLQEMTKDDAVHIRSELDQRATDLKNTLFAKAGILEGRAPVVAWLENNLEMHERSIGTFLDLVKVLQKGSYQMTDTGRLSAFQRAMLAAATSEMYNSNTQLWDDIKTKSQLTNLTLNTLKIGTREHEIACQQMRTAMVKYYASKDYLGTADFMCDMIDSVVVDSSDRIIKICRGSNTFNDVKRSEIDARRVRMSSKAAGQSSMNDYAALMQKKSKALQCPSPATQMID